MGRFLGNRLSLLQVYGGIPFPDVLVFSITDVTLFLCFEQQEEVRERLPRLGEEGEVDRVEDVGMRRSRRRMNQEGEDDIGRARKR